MKFAKLLSLGLVAFALFGCNQTSAISKENETVEAANTTQEEKSVSEKSELNNQNSSIQRVATKVNPSPPKVTRKILVKNTSENGIINETSYDTALKSLNYLTKGCQETTKTPENTKYSICKRGDKIVKASASSTILGDGNEYWFVDNRVIAVQQFHTGELFIYDKSGKLKTKFNYPKKVKSISSQDRKTAERLYNGYDYIFEVFNNKSSAKATASQSGIIDETSYQTFSKSLDSITQGCTKTKKTENYTDYEICKKDGKVVNASEYASEADAGLAYWFAPDGRVVAMRYLTNGDVFTFDRNGKVSAKFNVYDSKKINNISVAEKNQAEGNISQGSYKQILQRF